MRGIALVEHIPRPFEMLKLPYLQSSRAKSLKFNLFLFRRERCSLLEYS